MRERQRVALEREDSLRAARDAELVLGVPDALLELPTVGRRFAAIPARGLGLARVLADLGVLSLVRTLRPLVAFAAELASLFDGHLDRPDHVERLLRKVVVLAVDDLLEALDRVLELHVLAGRAGELLGDEVRLREEALDLART